MTLPGPNVPYWVRAVRLIFQPLEYVEDYQRRYGDVFRVGQKPPFVVYVGNPTTIQQLLAMDASCFQTGSGGVALRFLFGESSVLLLDGDRHLRQRKLLMPPFHGDRLKIYNQLICDAAEKQIAGWQERQRFLVRPVMQDITLKVILNVVFGLTRGERYEQLRPLLSAVLDALGSPIKSSVIFFPWLRKDWGAWSPWGRFVRTQQQVDQLIFDEIRDRNTGDLTSKTDILSLLMSARDEDGQPMTERELRDELITLLIAGHETTASALCWALYWIHKLPDVQNQLRSELNSLGNNPEPAEILRLPYLTAVCQETLRIYPIALTTGVRVLKQPVELNGYHLDAGTVLFPSIYLLHHREDLYPNSKQFLPERFLQRQFASYEYMPFGGGHRYCIGAALAMNEMKLTLATILRHWQLELASTRPMKPVRRGVTMAPPVNFSMIATKAM